MHDELPFRGGGTAYFFGKALFKRGGPRASRRAEPQGIALPGGRRGAGAAGGASAPRALARGAVGGAAPRAPRAARGPERLPALEPPREGEDIVADYASLGLTLGRHPLALLRSRLRKLRLLTAGELRLCPHGGTARVAGL